MQWADGTAYFERGISYGLKMFTKSACGAFTMKLSATVIIAVSQ
jgi:hypothetical protein